MSSPPKELSGQASTQDGRTTLETAVIVLVVLTAATHIYAGAVGGAPPVLLAGVGFLGGAALYLAGIRRHALAIAALPYTAVQIPLWYVIKSGNFTPIGYADKIIQVVLVIALLALIRNQRQA